ncbi:MAG: bifunctional metallophosphatase/5'-nucleotidase [Alphaproteobacteria bacterium]
MKKVLLAGVAALLTAAPASAQTTNLRVILLNDVDRKDAFPGIAAAVAEARAGAENSLLLHAGDVISPSVLSSLDKGAHIIDLMNNLGIDAFTPGNHEFDFGPAVLEERMAEATFPIVSSNIRNGAGELPGFAQEHMIVDLGSVQVGIYGLTSDDTYEKSSPGDWTFEDTIATGQAMRAKLVEAGADLVIALAHTSFSEDLALAGNGAADIIATGDDHDLFLHYNGKRVIMEGNSQGANIPVVDLAMEWDDDDLEWEPSFSVMQPDGEDAAMAAMVADYEKVLDDALSEEIATLGADVDTRRASVRTMETNFGNAATDAMMMVTGADIGMTNGGGIRGDKVYDSGSVMTARDVFAELPFGNKTVVLSMSGADVVAALENAVSKIEDTSGRFMQVSGNMAVVYDRNAAAGSRVVSAMINGSAIDAGATYTVATNDFLARGGDGYSMFASAEVVLTADASQLMASHVVDYIRANGISSGPEGRITFQ